MTTVAEVSAWMEEFAPTRLAESWDNVGLLWGDPAGSAERILTCLTVTPNVATEAVSERAGLIVSHHPVLFRAAKRIRADLPETGFLWSLARAGVAIYSPHTAFDNTQDGINDLICDRLGIVDTTALRPFEAGRSGVANTFKVVVFTPESDREAVLSAAFNAGAGAIGDYRECSFAIPGNGTFFGTENTDPTVGQRGRRETVAELRLELVCPGNRLSKVLAAVRAAHSYEEPAIDVYPLHVERSEAKAGAGRVGRLERPVGLSTFAAEVARVLDAGCVRMVGDPDRTIHRVAVCCGAGDEFLDDANRDGADVLLTGEARFHRGLEAEALGIGLITAGHHATERIGVEDLARRLASAFPTANVWPSRAERDPFSNAPGKPRPGPIG